jgi:RsiW-degrading membrane proteinase PrsW (M82 family)
MSMNTLNVWAILVAAVAAFVLGALWFSPGLFGKVWKKANGFGADEPPQATPPMMVLAFLLTLVMSANLAMFLNDPKTTLAWGATAGFLAGFGWVTMGIGIISIFERRPWTYVLVNGGYLTVALVVMGAILGGWR